MMANMRRPFVFINDMKFCKKPVSSIVGKKVNKNIEVVVPKTDSLFDQNLVYRKAHTSESI